MDHRTGNGTWSQPAPVRFPKGSFAVAMCQTVLGCMMLIVQITWTVLATRAVGYTSYRAHESYDWFVLVIVLHYIPLLLFLITGIIGVMVSRSGATTQRQGLWIAYIVLALVTAPGIAYLFIRFAIPTIMLATSGHGRDGAWLVVILVAICCLYLAGLFLLLVGTIFGFIHVCRRRNESMVVITHQSAGMPLLVPGQQAR